MMSAMSETNSILLLKTSCLSEGITNVFIQENVVSNITAIVPEKITNNRPSSFDGEWKELLTSSSFVCDMILLSENSPDIFRFPGEEILPCGQDNMFVFPSPQEKQNNNTSSFQLGLSNCIWDVNTTLTFDAYEKHCQNLPFEVSADTVSFQWNTGSESGRNVMAEASITIDLIPAQQLLMRLWYGRINETIDDTANSLAVETKPVDRESPSSEDRVSSSEQEQSPQISFAPSESMKTPESKRSETCKNIIHYTSAYPRFGKNQLKLLQNMVQSELDEIDRLIFFLQVITGLLLVFLGWSLVETIFWPSRPSDSRSSAGIPSSIQPIGDEKHENSSFRFESMDTSPISMDPSIHQPRHDIPENHEKPHAMCRESPCQAFPKTHVRLAPSLHGSSDNKSLYLSEALRASKGCASNTQKNTMGSTDDRFYLRPIPANITPDRWSHSSKPSQVRANTGRAHFPVQTIPNTRKSYIDEDCASGLDESGARFDKNRTANALSPSEMQDASSFISDYWG